MNKIEKLEFIRGKEERDRFKAYKKERFISDNLSLTDVPHYEHGKWAYETGCNCSTCRILQA